MPELPEVETVRRGLNQHLVGHKITGYKVLRDKSFPNDDITAKKFMVGAKVLVVKRRAKLLLIELGSKYTLMIHLKMTGQLVYRSNDDSFGAGHPSDSLISKLPDKSTRVVIQLNGAVLFFNDQRVFGWMKLIPTSEVSEQPFIRKLGPEPLEKEFTDEVFIKRVRRRSRSQIKPVILDQTVLAGVGNIYADEALWLAKIHPGTRVEDLTPIKLKRLRSAIVKVLRAGIKQGGSTDRNYVDARGKKGSYLSFAKVFRREGLECERCGGEIIKIKLAGRGTHICEHCQKLPKTP